MRGPQVIGRPSGRATQPGTMNREIVSAEGQIVGAVAGVITLANLAIQVRLNTQMMRRDAHLDLVRHLADPLIASTERPDAMLGKISAKDGSREPVTLAFMNAFDLTYKETIPFPRCLHRLGFGYGADCLFTGRSDHLDSIIPATLTFPNCKSFWQYGKEWLFSPRFGAYVDGLLDRVQAAQSARESHTDRSDSLRDERAS